MKKIQVMMFMLLVATMGITVQSCSKEETTIKYVNVAYGRGDLSTIYYENRDLVTIAGDPESLSDEDAEKVLGLLNAIKSADQSMESSSFDSMTDKKAVSIYQTALSSFVTGKGFSGYLLIFKIEDNKKTEIGRVTFSE